MLHRRTVLVCASFLLVSCAPIDVVAVGRYDIINGTRETGQPSIVAIQISAGGGMGGLCSGSVIGPYAVMTAKHCVFSEATGLEYGPSAFTVIEGSDLTVPGGVTGYALVSEIRTTPGSDIGTDLNTGNDIAILLLQTGLTVPALPTATSNPAIGTTVTIVGYGRTMIGTPSPTDAGRKYTGTAVVDRVFNTIRTNGPSATCQGDSGGALINPAGQVAGITSFGVDMSCTDPRSYYTPVSHHAALIAGALSWVPPCMPMPEICNSRDDDCDGVVDNGVGCFGIGDPCTTDSQCTGGSCANIDGSMKCTQPCDPTTAIPHCPLGIYCRATGCGTGSCVVGNGGAANDGDPCTADLECAATHCGSVSGVTHCGRACNTAASADRCPAGEVCDTSDGSGGCGTCVPLTLSTMPRPFGAPCDSNAMCASGMCADPGSPSSFCTQHCDATTTCGSGFHCRDGTCVGGDLGGPNAPCTSAMDCGMSAPSCVEVEGDHVCAGPCGSLGICTDPLTCAAAGDGMMYCLRPGASVGTPCTDGSTCRSGLCYVICTRFCSSADPCPTGEHCAAATPMDICQPGPPPPPPAHGGCSVSAGAGGAWSLAALGLLALWVRRHRR